MDVHLSDGWRVHFYDDLRAYESCPGAEHLDVHALARANRAMPGTPVFVRGDGRFDSRINRFWRDPSVGALKAESKSRYAASLLIWLNFLDATGHSWDQADAKVLSDFKFWRLAAGGAGSTVVPSTFRTDLAALKRFYDWAETEFPTMCNPVRARAHTFSTLGHHPAPLESSPSGMRRSDVKWLTPSAFQQWRDIGLRGFTADGLPSEDWIGRVEDRDVAFVDGLYGSGLRRGEWASMLTAEVPPLSDRRLVRCWLADSCAKRGSGRPYWLPRRAIQEVQFYLHDGGRREAIVRAQRAGRYDALNDLVLVDRIGNGALMVRIEGQSKRIRLDALTPRVRMRCYRETDSGLEPMWLWLNENGTPRPKTAWNRMFDVANQRVARVLGEGSLWARPHMLRHSFALRWYSIATMVAWQRTAGMTESEQRDYRDQLGDVWYLLSTLLGHRSSETTRSCYLEPFQGLQVENLLSAMENDERATLLRLIDSIGSGYSQVLNARSI